MVFSGHGSWDTLLKGHILLPRPRVIVHIKQQSYDINYVDVEKGHHHHEVSPGADAALLDVHSLAAARVPQRRRGEMTRLPLEPTKTLLVLTHPPNHCSSISSLSFLKTSPGLTAAHMHRERCYTLQYAYMAIQMQILAVRSSQASIMCVDEDLCRNFFFRLNRRKE